MKPRAGLIAQEAQRQGYVPNLQARALQRQLTQTIGLVLPNGGPRFPNPFFEEFVSGIGSEATAAGFDLLVSTASGDGVGAGRIPAAWWAGGAWMGWS